MTLTKSGNNPNNIICVINSFKPSNEASATAPIGTNGEKLFTTSNYIKIGSQNGNIICPVSNSLTIIK